MYIMVLGWFTHLHREFTKRVSLEKNRQGQILVDSHLRVMGDTSGRVFALGDCAQVEGHSLPCTGETRNHSVESTRSQFMNSCACLEHLQMITVWLCLCKL